MADEKSVLQMGNERSNAKNANGVPPIVSAIVAIIMVGAIVAAAVSFIVNMNSSKPSSTDDNSDVAEKSYDEIPDDCIEKASIKTQDRMNSVGGFIDFADAIHTKMGADGEGRQQMLHQWNGEYKSGERATYYCYTTIQSDGSETIDELWLDLEQLQ